MPIDFGNGLAVETVGELIGDTLAPETGWSPLVPSVLPGYEGAFPTPGIYFDMPEAVYHAVPALSSSGIKKLAASTMIFWASCPWLNPNTRESERDHYLYGRAYHCRLLEGREAFYSRFARDIDKRDYDGLLESTAEIKHAITQIALADAAGNPLSIKPVTTVEDEGVKRAARKEDWIKQLLELNPDAPIWEAISAQHREAHAGKSMLPSSMVDQIEIAAAMIESDPNVAPIMRGGQAEVSLFWHCPETGVPMKARVDKMKVRGLVDLKTFINQRERSVEQAIRFEIGGYRYNIQPIVYFEGAAEVRKLVRKYGEGAIHIWGDDVELTEDGPELDIERIADCVTFATKWASHVEPDFWRWVFQMKGDAPITRVVEFPRGGTVHSVTADIVRMAKRKFRECSEAYGTGPWVDTAPPYMIADEDIPISAVEI